MATAAVATGTSAPAMAETAAPAKVNYVALGDSYAAGYGAGTPENVCGQTSGAYPALWAKTAPDKVDFKFAACSGATTTDVASKQLGALNTGTDLVTVTTGGNDLDVFNLFQVCLDPTKASECIAAQAALKTALETTVPTAVGQLLTAVTAKAPEARIVLTGYPLPFGTGDECPGFTSVPKELRTFAIATIAGLNTMLSLQAKAAGVAFVDVASAFVGHDLCAGQQSWIVGLSGLQSRTIFHPTVEGQTDGYLKALVGKAGTVEEVLAWIAEREVGASPSPSTSQIASPTTTAAAGDGGGLPVTGVKAGIVVGVGLALAALGVVAFVLARRRRIQFTVD